MKTLVVERPWGRFEQFTHNASSTVKIISVKKGEAFSLQYHNHRTEFWKILSGTPEVTIGDAVVRARAGDEFEIPPQTNHRARSIDSDSQILEISTGDFQEDDIIRIEDKYGRA